MVPEHPDTPLTPHNHYYRRPVIFVRVAGSVAIALAAIGSAGTGIAAAQSVAFHSAVAQSLAPVHQSASNDLDGWILEALDVMGNKGIPGTYTGIHRNVIRESGGDPNAINLWDSNAAHGIPSKGLLQVIDPTFATYHVEGTSWNIYDPVANIAAACNYAAARYGTIDNVDSAY